MSQFTTARPLSLSKTTILEILNITESVNLYHLYHAAFQIPQSGDEEPLYALFCTANKAYKGWKNYPHRPGQEYMYESNEDETLITSQKAYDDRVAAAKRLVFLKNPHSSTHGSDYQFLGIYEFDKDYDYKKEKRFRYKLIGTTYSLLADSKVS